MTVPHLAMAGLAEAAHFYELLIRWVGLLLIAILLVLAFVFRSRTIFFATIALMAFYVWACHPWEPPLVSPDSEEDLDYRYWIRRSKEGPEPGGPTIRPFLDESYRR